MAVPWWEGRRNENVFMEITHRDRLGDDLLAPVTARGGGATGAYALVPLVKPGNVVVHYSSARQRIEGASRAVGPPEPTTFRWAARGVSARRARVEPTWVPGVRVPLHHFIGLDPPLTIAELRRVEDRIMRIRDSLQRVVGPRIPLYFPWMPYRGQPMRTSEAYLVKVPREVVDVLPTLRALVRRVERRDVEERVVVSPVDLAEEAVEPAAGNRGRRRGQGFAADQAAKTAVEARAMNAALAHFSTSWQVEDVHGNASFDLRCTDGSAELHVEVKGTTTVGEEVLLTPNEVRHARTFGHVALFVLAGIEVVRRPDGTVEASGGRPTVFDPWTIDDGVLEPIGFKYRVPENGGRQVVLPA